MTAAGAAIALVGRRGVMVVASVVRARLDATAVDSVVHAHLAPRQAVVRGERDLLPPADSGVKAAHHRRARKAAARAPLQVKVAAHVRRVQALARRALVLVPVEDPARATSEVARHAINVARRALAGMDRRRSAGLNARRRCR